MDISIQAVEEQWTIAAARANTAGETTALMRAQLIATLLAAKIRTDSDEVLVEGSWFTVKDLPEILGNYIRAEAEARRELKVRYLQLQDERSRNTLPGLPDPEIAETVEGIPVPGGVLIPDPDPEDEDDFFAEAKAARSKK